MKIEEIKKLAKENLEKEERIKELEQEAIKRHINVTDWNSIIDTLDDEDKAEYYILIFHKI